MTSLLSISILCLALLILMNKAASWNTINGLAPILDKYDTFIIDQWGVVHDGKTPYHGALECLEYLKSKNKNLIMLSNSSKRRASSVKGLHKVGIDPKLWSEIITSGEVGWNLIEDKKVPLKLKKGSEDGNRKFKVFVIGNGEDDADYVASCNCVPSSEDVEFILARGTFSIFAERETKFDTAEGLIHHLLETSMLEKFAKAKVLPSSFRLSSRPQKIRQHLLLIVAIISTSCTHNLYFQSTNTTRPLCLSPTLILTDQALAVRCLAKSVSSTQRFCDK